MWLQTEKYLLMKKLDPKHLRQIYAMALYLSCDFLDLDSRFFIYQYSTYKIQYLEVHILIVLLSSKKSISS